MDWMAASMWIAFRLGLSKLLSKKEQDEVSNLLDKKLEYYITIHNKFPTGREIVSIFEKTYDDVYWFYHGY